MITLYTRTNNILSKEFLKWLVKKIFNKYSGPDAVLDSLRRGLTNLNIPFEINPIKPKYETVHVLSGIRVLSEMITLKKTSKIATLIAGPTLVTTPHEHDNIIQNNLIDILLFPSVWTKDFYVSLAPQLSDKIKIWPAGVEIPNKISHKEEEDVLIFKKNAPNHIYDMVINYLNTNNIKHETIDYGKYNLKYYHDKLLNSSLLIYLQTTESQGLALQEAWAYDIPTLVWQNSTWKYKRYEWRDANISAPYLTEESGRFFNESTFSLVFESMIKDIQDKKINPRKYCIENLSDTATTKQYLEIIKNHAK